MVYAPQKASTDNCWPNNLSNFLHRDRGVFFPKPIIFYKRAWKLKSLPPIIKNFTWMMTRRALATAERAFRYSTHIDSYCATCDLIEDDTHLFFHCQLSRAVWFSSNPALKTDQLPQDNDGLQLILPNIRTNAMPDHIFSKLLITMWYI